MRDYPKEIEERAVYLYNITLERDEVKDSLNAVEDRIAYEVITEKDGNGKPQYSNETLRGIAIRERCAQLEQWKDLKASLESFEVLKAQAAARLERLRGEFSIHKIERRERIAEIESSN